MRVVVTGGAGFIGANLCARLARTPAVARVVAFDDLSSGSARNLDAAKVGLVRGSVCDPSAVLRVCDGAEAIVHLAAVASVAASIADPRRTHEVNVTGTLNVLEAARELGIGYVVIASSSAVYGDTRVLPIAEDAAAAPLSSYAASKLAAESYSLAYSQTYGMDVLALRFFNVFGPLQPADHAYAAAVPAAIAAGLAARPFTVFGDGTQTRDFVDVNTVCSVIVTALQSHPSVVGPVNVATGRSTSIIELLNMLETVLERPVQRRYEPRRKGDVGDSRADTSLLFQLFPDLRPAPLLDSLAKTVAWFRTTRDP